MPAENVLCVSDLLLKNFVDRLPVRCKEKQGFFQCDLERLIGNLVIGQNPNATLPNNRTYFGMISRDECEDDTNFRQLCSYVVLNNHEKIATYERGKSGGENRLHAFRSIGVGGHINDKDMKIDPQDIITTLRNQNIFTYVEKIISEIYAAVHREVDEETINPLGYHLDFSGIIYVDDPADEKVHRVHAGLVFEASSLGDFLPMEDCLTNFNYRTPRDLVEFAINGELELWSQILVNNLKEARVSFL